MLGLVLKCGPEEPGLKLLGAIRAHPQSVILTTVLEGALHVPPTLRSSLKHKADSVSPPTKTEVTAFL